MASRSSRGDTPEDLFALWQEAVERARANLAGGADPRRHGPAGPRQRRRRPAHANLRRLVVDMIDEYALHNGQADLIRESVDGLVGEDPPVREYA